MASGGAKKWHSWNELIKMGDIQKEFSKNIQSWFELVTFDQYLQLQESGQIQDTTRFWRQKYNQETGQLTPDLPRYCSCWKHLNPDDVFFRCPSQSCSNLMHPKCMALAPVKKCSECHIRIGIKLYASPKKSDANKWESPAKLGSPVDQSMKWVSNFSPRKWTKPDKKPEKRVRTEEDASMEPVEEDFSNNQWAYPSLTKDESNKLHSVISQWKSNNQQLNKAQ